MTDIPVPVVDVKPSGLRNVLDGASAYLAEKETVYAFFENGIERFSAPLSELAEAFPNCRRTIATPFRPIVAALIWALAGGVVTMALAIFKHLPYPFWVPMLIGAMVGGGIGYAANAGKSVLPFWVVFMTPDTAADGTWLVEGVSRDIGIQDEKAQLLTSSLLGWIAKQDAWRAMFRAVDQATQKLQMMAMFTLIGCVAGIIILGLVVLHDQNGKAKNPPLTKQAIATQTAVQTATAKITPVPAPGTGAPR